MTVVRVNILKFRSNLKNCFSPLLTAIESDPEPSQPESLAQPPSFIRPITNTMVTEGTPAKFEAVFSGVPTPEVTWIRNGIQTLQDCREYKVSVLFIYSVDALF